MNVLIRKAPTSTALKQAERRRGGDETLDSGTRSVSVGKIKSSDNEWHGCHGVSRPRGPHHSTPPRHTPWGDSTRLHAVSAMVWLRSNSQPGQGLHLGMDQACIDRGVDIQQLRRQGTGRGSKPTQHSQKKIGRVAPTPELPSSRLINTSTSPFSRRLGLSLRPINHSRCWFRPPVGDSFLSSDSPLLPLFFCVHSRHQLPSLRFSLSCRHHRQHFPLSSCRLSTLIHRR